MVEPADAGDAPVVGLRAGDAVEQVGGPRPVDLGRGPAVLVDAGERPSAVTLLDRHGLHAGRARRQDLEVLVVLGEGVGFEVRGELVDEPGWRPRPRRRAPDDRAEDQQHAEHQEHDGRGLALPEGHGQAPQDGRRHRQFGRDEDRHAAVDGLNSGIPSDLVMFMDRRSGVNRSGPPTDLATGC